MKSVVVDGVLQQAVFYLEGVVVTLHEGFYTPGVDVETDGGEFCREEASQREAHIAEANHTNLYVVECHHIIEAINSISSSVR